MSAITDIEDPPRVPAPPDLIARAEDLVKKHSLQCFWFWHPDARVKSLEDLEIVIRNLRHYGNHEAWNDAQELRKCL